MIKIVSNFEKDDMKLLVTSSIKTNFDLDDIKTVSWVGQSCKEFYLFYFY